MDKFPTVRGISPESKMKPRFNNRIFNSATGYEVRTNLQDQPLWDFEVNFEFLNNRRNGSADLELIQAFWLERRGSFQTFLFEHTEEPFQEGTSLGVGNGVTTDFLLQRATGGFTEIAGGVFEEADILLYKNGVVQSYANFNLIDHRTVRFVTAPPSGHTITADYKPLFRVRFAEDIIDFDSFMHRLWALQSLELRGAFL